MTDEKDQKTESTENNSNRDRNYKKLTIFLTIVIISLSVYSIWLTYQFNDPSPKLEIATYDYETAWMSVLSVEDMVIMENGTAIPNMNEIQSYNLTNFTCQVYNSGKGAAYGVKVTLDTNPPEEFSLISTYVFVGTPIESNFLGVSQNEYLIGLLPPKESYVFFYSVKYPQNTAEKGTIILTVDSDNANVVSHYNEIN